MQNAQQAQEKARARNELSKLQTTIVVKTLEGDKEYTFQLLKRREAAKIFHETLLVVVKAFSKIMGKDDVNAEDVMEALAALDFDTFETLSSALLKNAIVGDFELGPDVFDTDYYETRPEEQYIAVGYAIMCNWPGVFTKIQSALKGSGALDKAKKALS